jgi:hypothetical protein
MFWDDEDLVMVAIVVPELTEDDYWEIKEVMQSRVDVNPGPVLMIHRDDVGAMLVLLNKLDFRPVNTPLVNRWIETGQG